MRRISTIRFCGGIAIATSLACGAPAVAQDESGDVAAENQSGINTITVTARRQEETLQDAAIPIDAVTADTLAEQGIQVADDLNRAVPAINIVNGGGQATSIFMRGVGNVTVNSFYDAAISPSYDGVVLGRPSGAFGTAFYDLQRIEVLKGPQGILYGRNATGGAVNIIPEHPELGEFGAGLRASYGNYDAFSIEGYVNVPASDHAALRVSATRQTHDGYNRDGSDDLDRWGGRAQLLLDTLEGFDVRLSVDYTEIGGVGPGSDYLGHFQGGVFIPSGLPSGEGLFTDAANAYRQTVLGAPGFGFLQPLQEQQMIDAEYLGVHAEINVETPLGDLTFIPAYRETDSFTRFYGPSFNGAIFDEAYEQYSAELRLAGSAGIVDYIVGGFYFNEDVAGKNEFNQEFVLPMQSFTGNTESIAGFGQVTLNITEQFRLSGGLRYTKDKKSLDGSVTNFITFCGPNAPPPVTPPASLDVGCQLPGALPHYPSFLEPQDALDWLIDNGWIAPTSTLDQLPPIYPVLSQVEGDPPGTVRGRILYNVSAPNDSGTFDKITWRVGAEYDVTPDSLLYATVETGYRAGGFQPAEGVTSYDPETITAFTLGSKNRFLDDRLQVNVEAFWWEYRDQQITFFTISPSGVLISANQNVGSSQMRGFDVDVIARPLANTTLNGKVQYLDTEYQGLLLSTAPPRDNFNCPSSVTGTLADGVTPIITFDCSGRPALFSPTWSVNLGIEQVVPLSGSFDLVLSARTSWRDEQYGNFNYLDFQLIDDYWLSDAQIELQNIDQDWSIAAFVNNIEGNREIAFPQASPIGFANARLTAPRTYGVRVTGDF